ncbi:MAG: hypothetical protein A3K19_04255 [Lentisphaerae bacterium RIFOXYB12_FULL_65_16]|nr:MAG: hypothetical protein A3K18_09440 [Lentisphaerae bacterium RIFOXYA12_64_32]OGV84296.1 MAG: hypothetical protein A3K19_04255 [Lentisphaerae bacterium RIFOXYB12_FULL_65_16]
MTVQDLIKHIIKLKGSGLNGDEGVLFGDPNAEIRGLLLCWMADVGALRAAAAQGCNVVLCHEQFYFTTMFGPLTAQEMSWPANRARLAAAAAGGLTVLRVHGSLDMICIWDEFIRVLGVENPTPGTGWNKVLPIPRTTVRELVAKVKATFNVSHVRMTGDLDKVVSVAGFPWGGLGLDTNVGYQATCVNLGAEVLIAGECDEYGFSFARDAGVPMIETGHALSENPGVKLFAARLEQEFAGLKTVFHPDTSAFTTV